MKKVKATSRYSSEKHHREFGLLKWFRLRGVPDSELQDEIINNYCEIKGCSGDKIAFIDRRFQEFTTWVGANYKLMPMGGWKANDLLLKNKENMKTDPKG